jgi:hypothetical protein
LCFVVLRGLLWCERVVLRCLCLKRVQRRLLRAACSAQH